MRLIPPRDFLEDYLIFLCAKYEIEEFEIQFNYRMRKIRLKNKTKVKEFNIPFSVICKEYFFDDFERIVKKYFNKRQ